MKMDLPSVAAGLAPAVLASPAFAMGTLACSTSHACPPCEDT
jgi:hypothetical protein